jgi:hypothetical protein
LVELGLHDGGAVEHLACHVTRPVRCLGALFQDDACDRIDRIQRREPSRVADLFRHPNDIARQLAAAMVGHR